MNIPNNWGLIRSGSNFESLVRTLLAFVDPSSRLFGRPGRDAGQDAKTENDTVVVQCKFHVAGTATQAIADAKAEVAKLARYLDPKDARAPLWRGVTHWRLVTNLEFGPQDDAAWTRDVQPLFAALGLRAQYWDRARIDALLVRFPDVVRAFFGAATRAFASLPEVHERLISDDPFLRRPVLNVFVGREPDLASIKAFVLSERSFLVLHGQGGVGKTRLAVEAVAEFAERGEWQFLWANKTTMLASSEWFGGVAVERPTVLIVDEPDDPRLLQLLVEQLNGLGRLATWKVIVSVRSPKDPVLRYLRTARLSDRVVEQLVLPLPEADAARMCAQLLATGPLVHGNADRLVEWGAELAKRAGTYPVWLTLAVHLLETRGDLRFVPTSAAQLASEYWEEIVGQKSDALPAGATEALMRWVALLSPFNREDRSGLGLVKEQVGLDEASILAGISELVARRALVERGAARRLVEVRPDVMRDYVLSKWLVLNSAGAGGAIPSTEARQLVQMIVGAIAAEALSPLGVRILVALARTEFLLRFSGVPVDLVGEVFRQISAKLAGMNLVKRLEVADLISEIAYVRPADVVELSGKLRAGDVSAEIVETHYGRSRTTRVADVVLALPWTLFQAAAGAATDATQLAVLVEMLALVEGEETIRALGLRIPNDGKRAYQLVSRIIEGGPDFIGRYEHVAEALALERLRGLTASSSPASILATSSLCAPILSVGREHTSYENHTFSIRRYLILPTQTAWAVRANVQGEIRRMASAAGLPPLLHGALWKLLVESHGHVTDAVRNTKGEVRSVFRQEIVDGFKWLIGLFEAAKPQLPTLLAARPIWDWHRKYESDQELKSLAESLEGFYVANELAAEFDELTSWDDLDSRSARTVAMAEQLSRMPSVADLNQFIQRAIAYYGDDIGPLMGVAWELGRLTSTDTPLSRFAMESLAGSQPQAQRFAAQIARGWISAARLRRDNDVVRLISLLAKAASDAVRLDVVASLFDPPQAVAEFSVDEHQFLRGQADQFQQRRKEALFLHAAAWTYEFDWDGLRPLLEKMVASAPSKEMAISQLIDSASFGAHAKPPKKFPEGFGLWLLNLVIHAPNLDSIGDNTEWRLNEILKVCDRPDVEWLPFALRTQLKILQESKDASSLGLQKLGSYVRTISADSALRPSTIAAVDDLFGFLHREATVAYFLPAMLVEIDPAGLLVPNRVVNAVANAPDIGVVRRLARVGGAYSVGTPSWRVVARAALQQVTTDQHQVFGPLSETGIVSWHGTPGDVAPMFVQAVELARRQAHEEADPLLAPFWAWRIEVAERDLERASEEAREERGE